MSIFESLENLNVSEECFNDILSILEEYINELNSKTYRLSRDKAEAIVRAQEENKANVKSADDLKAVEDDIAKRKHQAAIFNKKYEDQIVAELENKEKAKKKK